MKKMHKLFSKDRIEALTDGIYAIAMTILVLNIDIDKIYDGTQDGGLLTLPCGMGPKVYQPEECEPQLRNLLDVALSIAS